MNTQFCALGNPTETNYNEYPDLCECPASCEPHIHNEKDGILCLHDGENEHGHCPNSPGIGFIVERKKGRV